MVKLIKFVAIALSISSLFLLSSPEVVLAAKPSNSKTTQALTGNDVSWPQCGKSLPSGQLFGIVGVNDGVANTTNPCFNTELAWANNSLGTTAQGKVALYVNTANPGNLGVADWPTSGYSSQYGYCYGGDDQACAYVYGWTEAELDAQTRIGSNSPLNYKWWLDVETTNSWETNKANNDADLTGMVDFFKSIGVQVGIYSTSYQWGVIAGTVSSTSSLYGLDSWLPGSRTLSAAEAACSSAGLSGGKTTLTQYVSGRLDYDYSCV
ncbi:MAG TPA: hypothetical protein VFN31_00785 [Candidatus Saccharimonadales bacterium]|nr:hypothetical protein [Candidatus Saccharimonadales bacterium]